MSALRKIGKFFRLTEFDSAKLSLTNICMWVCILKLALATDPSYAEIGSLFLALAAYNVKRVVNKRDALKSQEQVAEIDQLKNKITTFDDSIKEINDKVGTLSLAAGFKNFKK